MGKSREPIETLSTERLDAEIGELAAHINAATCRWLELVAEFDRRDAHEGWGFQHCSSWLSWRCSLAPRAAREHVRVANALVALPLVRASFARGELSYSKVRALTRIASERNEPEVVELGLHATAAQLERVTRSYLRAQSIEQANESHARRHLAYHWDDDGTLSFRGRLSAEDGPLFLRAIEAGREAANAERPIASSFDGRTAGRSRRAQRLRGATPNASARSATAAAFASTRTPASPAQPAIASIST